MKKLPLKLQQQLLSLKHIQLNEADKASVHAHLSQHVAPDAVAKSSLFKALLVAFKSNLRVFRMKPVAIFVLLLAVIVGPGVATVSAARASLPGDALYPVKRNLEEIQLKLAFTDEQKVQTQISHVANRLDELQRIAKEQAPSAQRQENIGVALAELKKETDGVKQTLETVNDQGSSDQANLIALAKTVEEKTNGYQADIKSSVGTLDKKTADDAHDLEQALSSVQEVALGALDILAQKHEAGSAAVEKDDLQSRVQTQLASLKDQLTVLKSRVAQLTPATPLADASTPPADDSATNDATSEPAPEDKPAADENDPTDASTDKQQPETPAAPTIAEQAAAIGDTLNNDVTDQIDAIQQVIDLGQFSAALDQIAKTKSRLDDLNQKIRSLLLQMVADQAQDTQNLSTQDSTNESTDPTGDDASTTQSSDSQATDQENQSTTDQNDTQTTTDAPVETSTIDQG